MPQIWLKRKQYDELTKRGYVVEQKVDELVGNLLKENDEDEGEHQKT